MTIYDELQEKSNQSLRNAIIALIIGTILGIICVLTQSIIVFALFLATMIFTIVELIRHQRAQNKMDDIIDDLYNRSRYGK